MFSGATKSRPRTKVFFGELVCFLRGAPGCLVPVSFLRLLFFKQTLKTLVSKLLLTSLLKTLVHSGKITIAILVGATGFQWFGRTQNVHTYWIFV